MFPEIFKDLSAREIQKLFPIQIYKVVLGHELERLLLLAFLSLTKSKSINTTAKEAEGAEAKAKAAQAYTEEASKTLRGRNICKRH
ncbi:hypothetical protein IGI04_035968 [Brassica rapa subsp. trilocularis]|uniref:Flotillin-like n=1 Tax=Brassica rapa subsp. trilocularis TaxID=1813537 RepID=A0ABQ7LD44_BRACM|nr:hypothetical protein IGI04_035968 [Brassica rapa subsp. trilocularis]